MAIREKVNPIRVRPAVFEAVQVWRNRQNAVAGLDKAGGGYPSAESILQSIPRRQQAVPPDERKLWIPYVDQLPIRNTFGRSFVRLFAWLRVILTIGLGNFFRSAFAPRYDRAACRALSTCIGTRGWDFCKIGSAVGDAG